MPNSDTFYSMNILDLPGDDIYLKFNHIIVY